ncbi:MAG TPA: succinate dehydrogenase/fumarate reductase iron-sulfur subunit [Limnochorda sp.]
MSWRLKLKIHRWRPGDRAPHYDLFEVEVPEDAYVLDAIEKVWAEQDRSLAFRHACHHASCGSCGLRINGREKLPCITPVTDYRQGSTVQVDPLRHFPLVRDLVVDMGPLARAMDEVRFSIIRQASEEVPASLPPEPPLLPDETHEATRFENCLECGLCVSACPVAGSSVRYLGPAALAAAERMLAEPRGVDPAAVWAAIDHDDGLWRCHGAFECSAACPSEVDPAAAIMRLRRYGARVAEAARGRRR